MKIPQKYRRLMAASLAVSLLAASCSGSDADSADTTAAPTTTSEVATETTSEATTTTASAQAVDGGAPLTGEEIAVGTDLSYPALAVKIDNHPDARPQTGIDMADVVFEMRAEGVTRFMAVFHSQQPSPIGPVRSSRTSDFDLIRGLSNPLYASSGGNDYVARGLRSLPMYGVTALTSRAYFRGTDHRAPHNLYANSPDLFSLAPDDAGPPTPWFKYRAEGTDLVSTARPITGAVTIAYKEGPIVTHTWDEATGGWLRTQDGRPHTTVEGDQLSPENVVIMAAKYIVSPADSASPELISVGGGTLYVLTDGNAIEGTWTRETAESAPVLLDADGTEILLTPGRTWVLYPEEGQVRLPLN